MNQESIKISLHLATRNARISELEYCIDSRLEINDQDLNDYTTLHLAAMTGQM